MVLRGAFLSEAKGANAPRCSNTRILRGVDVMQDFDDRPSRRNGPNGHNPLPTVMPQVVPAHIVDQITAKVQRIVQHQAALGRTVTSEEVTWLVQQLRREWHGGTFRP